MAPATSRPAPPLLALLAFGGLSAVAAALGALATRRGKTPWYGALRKSRLTPPGFVFGPVWTALYALSAVSGYRVWKTPPSRERSRALSLWAAQLAFNGAWSWLFFRRHRAGLALGDLVALWAALVGYTVQARRVDRAAAGMMLPYLGWVSFAGYLNEEIVRRNAKTLN